MPLRSFTLLLLGLISTLCLGVEPFIPRKQTQPPGPPLSPAEAIKRMHVPDGFTVELVASEPEIVNPVAMTFDERGRVWITESFEYPRREPGLGRDRVKVLEDTDGDGKADKFTVFAEGLNIPSGIAVGHGGVWVANSPDILFMQDTDGDGKADKREVVVTGFGRSDTHELPNSLTWGPDGYLYGLNGVFNPSHVEHRGRKYDFTCALFRINPRTRDFEIFAEGTSNPWGVAWDPEGSAFLSACVIDHLWHITESGYYLRQGGPYPPFTWHIGSIVKHTHQLAAYCGIHYFDSEAYPPEYRDRLYMGNIHGGCINVDVLHREGSTYAADAAGDFLTANDAWFMPVVQKTGPDGCLYILDWYDRYHCYQDANADPKGIDRGHGRLYRVHYKDMPRAPRFDLAKESDDQLLDRLNSPNVFYRDIAQRLLSERNAATTRAKLESVVLDTQALRKMRMHALWALVGTGSLDLEFHHALLAHTDPGLRSWGVRAAGNFGRVEDALRTKIKSLSRDEAPDVKLQVAIAARKLEGVQPLPLLIDVLAYSGNDKLIPRIVWQNLHPLLEEHTAEFLTEIKKHDLSQSPNLRAILPRATERMVAAKKKLEQVATLLEFVIDADEVTAADCLQQIIQLGQSGELKRDHLNSLQTRLSKVLRPVWSAESKRPLHDAALQLATLWDDAAAVSRSRKIVADVTQPPERRGVMLSTLAATGDPKLVAEISSLLTNSRLDAKLQSAALTALAKFDSVEVARAVLAAFSTFSPELQAQAVTLLTQRPAWSRELVLAVQAGKLPAGIIGLSHLRSLLASRDQELAAMVIKQWGTVRTERNPEREQVIAKMRESLQKQPGDAFHGQIVFQKVCAQCHKIHGTGQEVGPDITSTGRSSFDQLLSNVFDPSLVIGPAYQAVTVVTTDGRVQTGLLAEDSDQRVLLKTQGGKLETIARDDVEEVNRSKLSLMPENLEQQLKPAELADLFAFLALDKPPQNRDAKLIPGAPEQR